MAQSFEFTTGPAPLPDVGTLYYNGCTFSSLFESKVNGKVVRDEANRTTKYMEYTIVVDGYVTLSDEASSINDAMSRLRLLLTAQAGSLVYRGRGLDLVVNTPGVQPIPGSSNVSDVAWGPVPDLLEFQPLGSGRSAKVRWQVVTRVPDITTDPHRVRLLQLNFETTVTYSEDGYSGLSIRGTLEVPKTRLVQGDRTLLNTVDDHRNDLESKILTGIDLARFRMVKRDFSVSRDKRTLTFDIALEEKAYMDLPEHCTAARGTFSFRQKNAGMGFVSWLCSLRATYTVRADRPRRAAWEAFLALVLWRMRQAELFGVVPRPAAAPAAPNPLFGSAWRAVQAVRAEASRADPLGSALRALRGIQPAAPAQQPNGNRALLIDLTGEEGLYLDSKTVTFSATWWIVTELSRILAASGMWKKLPEKSAAGNNLWAVSMRDVQGTTSWLPNRLDHTLDVIVDFGGGV